MIDFDESFIDTNSINKNFIGIGEWPSFIVVVFFIPGSQNFAQFEWISTVCHLPLRAVVKVDDETVGDEILDGGVGRRRQRHRRSRRHRRRKRKRKNADRRNPIESFGTWASFKLTGKLKFWCLDNLPKVNRSKTWNMSTRQKPTGQNLTHQKFMINQLFDQFTYCMLIKC